ncbi:hypothetical protein BDV98DRAFT_318279 [Pterulicium gracile]|uniref:Uncharacterized protein n=1 Tax=Pterulicium gracile TaxID=1884261 RepID=A0A5C3R187_9AGAR|nr:hypothetical protein BDV98DRAFT_318279 [Pterula gracilis]
MKNFRQDTLFTKQLQLLHSDWFASRTTGGLSVWVWESCSTTMEAKSNRSNLTKCPRLIILRLLGFTTACPSGLQQVIACKVVACPSLAGRRSAQGYQRPVQREATKYNFRRSSGSRRRSRAPSSPVALLIQVVHSGNRKVQWPESHALVATPAIKFQNTWCTTSSANTICAAPLSSASVAAPAPTPTRVQASSELNMNAA